MVRALKFVAAVVAVHAANVAWAADCACPLPSCSAPVTCFTEPSCAAPGMCSSGCQTCNVAPSCGGCEKCSRPKARCIHIDLSRTIHKGDKVKKNGGFMGEAPPVGASVVMSSPVVFSATAALPISFNQQASASSIDVNALASAIVTAQKASAAAAAPAAAASNTCNDPCGDIKQLQADMAILKNNAKNMENLVQELIRLQTGK